MTIKYKSGSELCTRSPLYSGAVCVYMAGVFTGIPIPIARTIFNRHYTMSGWTDKYLHTVLKKYGVMCTREPIKHMRTGGFNYIKNIIDNKCSILVNVNMWDFNHDAYSNRNKTYKTYHPFWSNWLYVCDYDVIYHNTVQCMDPTDSATYGGRDFDQAKLIRAIVNKGSDFIIIAGRDSNNCTTL